VNREQDELQHKQRLIAIYKQNLQHLQVRQAREGITVDVSVINQIDNVQDMISELQTEIDKFGSIDRAYTLRKAPTPLQKYDSFITRFSEELKAWNGEPHRFIPSVLNSLRRATPAKYAFIGQFIEGQWKIIAEHEDIGTEIVKLIKENTSLRELLLKAASQQSLTIGVLSDSTQTCLLMPYNETKHPQILVLYETKPDFEFDLAFHTIIQTILDHTDDLLTPKKSELLEMAIYNALRRKFGYVSDTMYARQFYLFNQRLETMTIYFEPIVALSPTAPSLFGWEALARDISHPDISEHKAPSDLFETATLWGSRFILQLDIYFLQKATSNYVIDYSNPKSPKTIRKDRILPLSVNVYPESLIRTRYYETVKKIEERGIMPLNKLYLEISEKSLIPIVEKPSQGQHDIEAFRERLFRYNDLEIRFSIDDFGVGYSSTSRLSRLGPACIKIDRDALTDQFGNFTLEFVTKLARRMPGDIRVIAEGHDHESNFSLRRLYELGIRYVQSHRYGLARPQVDNRLPSDAYNEICSALKGL
jgi:EAL domain-containing protein (putative c-di-GMP-specific phosphodiesterase class I)